MSAYYRRLTGSVNLTLFKFSFSFLCSNFLSFFFRNGRSRETPSSTCVDQVGNANFEVGGCSGRLKDEHFACRLFIDPEAVKRGEAPEFALAFARIETHYFVHGGWFRSKLPFFSFFFFFFSLAIKLLISLKGDEQLLEDAHKIAHIPGVIVQGRYDVVCPAITAFDLHKRWPKAEYFVIPDAGHSMKEDGILSKLVEAADQYRDL
jgi:pimeloyl-ACP methyl ester carboxylesterase